MVSFLSTFSCFQWKKDVYSASLFVFGKLLSLLNMSVVIFYFSCCFYLILPVSLHLSLYIISISVGPTPLCVMAWQSPLQNPDLGFAVFVCLHIFVLLHFAACVHV